MKLKLQLTLSELQALNSHLHLSLSAYSMDDLRGWWEGFAIMSSVKEIYDKTSQIVEHARIFPTRSDKVYKVSLTQAQALALACTTQSDQPEGSGEVLPFDQTPVTFENSVTERILGKIHQAYLV